MMDSDAAGVGDPMAGILGVEGLEPPEAGNAGFLNAVPDPLLVIELPDRVVACNLEAERLLALPGGFRGPFRLSEQCPPAHAYGAEEPLPVERWLDSAAPLRIRFEGDARWFLPRWSAQGDGRRRTLLLRDVSREIEHEERLTAMRQDFLSAAAHKFSTPLTAIKLYVHLLKAQESRKAEPSERGPQLTVLDQHVNRLSAEISEAIDLAELRVGPLRLNLQPMELLGVVRRVIDQLSLQRSERKFTFEHVEPYLIGHWDEQRIAQVIRQLLDNADRYSPIVHPVAVTAQGADDSVRLEVRDLGIGVPPEDHAHLFEPYFRGKYVTSQRLGAGLGLGLYLSRRIVEQHGGSIEIDSAPGRGTRVVVTLPRTPPGM